MELIYVAPSTDCTESINRPTTVKGLDLMKKMKLQYFCIFINIWYFLKSFMVFFVWKAYQLFCHAKTAQLVSWQRLASTINKISNIFTKQFCSHHWPLRHEDHHRGIGIPGYTFGSVARAIPPSSWGSASR